MKTHVFNLQNAPIPQLDGRLHAQEALLPEGTTELVLENVGPRVVAIIGFDTLKHMSLATSHRVIHTLGSRGTNIMRTYLPNFFRKEHFTWFITPGKIDEISESDTDLMEQALRDAVENSDYLLSEAGSVRAFQTVKDRALERPIQHTQLYEKLIQMLVSRGLRDVSEQHQFYKESKRDIHPWQEIVRNIFDTNEGRTLWRELRPVYLERKRKEEEYELSEFRSIHRRFQQILRTFRPSQLLIGSTSDVGRLEIIARHLAKNAGDFHPLFGGSAVRSIHLLESKILLDTLKIVPLTNPNI